MEIMVYYAILYPVLLLQWLSWSKYLTHVCMSNWINHNSYCLAMYEYLTWYSGGSYVVVSIRSSTWELREKDKEDNKLSARHRLVSDGVKDLNAGQSPAPYIIVNEYHTRWSVFGQDGQFSSVPQVMSDTLWPHGLQHARLPCPSPTPRALLRLMSIDLVMPSNHLIYCCPLLLLPSIIPSIRVFSNESVLPIRWLKYWSFSFSISPSSEYSGLISFRMDWLDLFGVQGTLKSLLQHHSSNASILQHSAFFIVQLSHTYMTTG